MFNGVLAHQVLVHFPIAGILFCLLGLIFGLWRRNIEIQRLSLGMLVLAGIVAIATYLSGLAAEIQVLETTNTPRNLVEMHAQASVVAFWFLEGIAIIALSGLLMFNKMPRMPAWFSTVMLIGLLVGGTLLVNTGLQGKKISHPEIETQGSLLQGNTLQS